MTLSKYYTIPAACCRHFEHTNGVFITFDAIFSNIGKRQFVLNTTRSANYQTFTDLVNNINNAGEKKHIR